MDNNKELCQMHLYGVFAAAADYMVENAWWWFWIAGLFSLAVAVRDTPDIWRKIKGNARWKKAWPIRNLHWAALVAAIIGAVSSQLGSDRSEAEIERQSNEVERIEAKGIARAKNLKYELRTTRRALEDNIASGKSSRVFKDIKGSVARLTPFKETKAAITCVDDGEARNTMRQIIYVLKAAGWTITTNPVTWPDPEPFLRHKAVLVESVRVDESRTGLMSLGEEGRLRLQRMDKLDEAAMMLSAELNAATIATGFYVRNDLDSPRSVVFIRVGLKP